jgi:hypothetical protein
MARCIRAGIQVKGGCNYGGRWQATVRERTVLAKAVITVRSELGKNIPNQRWRLLQGTAEARGGGGASRPSARGSARPLGCAAVSDRWDRTHAPRQSGNRDEQQLEDYDPVFLDWIFGVPRHRRADQ